MKITRRMKQIVKLMKENKAHIQERRDTFRERSTYAVEWKSDDGLYHSIGIKERTLEKLVEAGLIEITENNPVYSKGGRNYGKFLTSESVYELVNPDFNWVMKAAQEICDRFNVGDFSHSYREWVEDEFYAADDTDKKEMAEIILAAYSNRSQ